MKNATSILTSAIGGVAAFAGLEHGIGEILQGDKAPASVWIQSWPGAAFFASVNGEPALTIIPNLLVTGVVSILISLAFLLCITVFVKQVHAGLVLIGLSATMLLFGGGIFPPVLGLLVSFVAMRINRPVDWCPERLHRFIAWLWPWSLAACLASWLLLFPGSSLLDYFLGINLEEVMFVLIGIAFGLFVLTTFEGFAIDSRRENAS